MGGGSGAPAAAYGKKTRKAGGCAGSQCDTSSPPSAAVDGACWNSRLNFIALSTAVSGVTPAPATAETMMGLSVVAPPLTAIVSRRASSPPTSGGCFESGGARLLRLAGAFRSSAGLLSNWYRPVTSPVPDADGSSVSRAIVIAPPFGITMPPAGGRRLNVHWRRLVAASAAGGCTAAIVQGAATVRRAAPPASRMFAETSTNRY